jgi:hypothetical protein
MPICCIYFGNKWIEKKKIYMYIYIYIYIYMSRVVTKGCLWQVTSNRDMTSQSPRRVLLAIMTSDFVLVRLLQRMYCKVSYDWAIFSYLVSSECWDACACVCMIWVFYDIKWINQAKLNKLRDREHMYIFVTLFAVGLKAG